MSALVPELLSAVARTAVPWKNGGGITREVCAAPPGAGLESFDWRISTAQVSSAGPFSAFAGIDRTLCILRGELQLRVAGQGEHRLTPDSPPLRFRGESSVYAEPLGEAVVDLNVMVRRGRCTAQVNRRSGPGAIAAQASVTVLYALEPLVVSGATSFRLNAHDALRTDPGAELRVTAPSARFYLIELTVHGVPA